MKTIKYLAMVALMAVIGAGLTSCGGYSNGKAADMLRKSYDDKLKKEDYSEMIEWYEDITNEILDRYEKIVKDNKKYEDFSIASIENVGKLNGKYPFFDAVVGMLNSADEDEMGKSNYKKYHKLRDKYFERLEKLSKKAPEKKEKNKKKAFDEEVMMTEEAPAIDEYDDYEY